VLILISCHTILYLHSPPNLYCWHNEAATEISRIASA